MGRRLERPLKSLEWKREGRGAKRRGGEKGKAAKTANVHNKKKDER